MRPGDVFHVDMIIPPKDEKKGKSTAEFVGLTAGGIDVASRKITVKLRAGGSERDDLYTLRSHASHHLGGSTYRMYFRFPQYMPQGNYAGTLTTGENLYADYQMHYAAGDGVTRYQKILPVNIWQTDKSVNLEDLTFIGDPNITPPSARGQKVIKER